ncbi:MAG TPA: tetratricopeptide repeat protein [Steroidobacteraceae bacterium]|nr:tetratricopeptide repeat protein [Steroidobacteraceae bacterium]
MLASRLTAALMLAGLLAGSALAAEEPKGTLAPTTVKDLYYGDVLFYFYQDDYFNALTRLRAAQEKHRMAHHADEAELLLGGLYLSYGEHLEAGAIFDRLLKADAPLSVRNRAWFYLGKVWYQRGYWAQAENALRKVEGELPAQLEAEKRNLLAQVLIQQGRYDDAIALLNGWRGPPDWTAFAQFNLGVALVRKGRLADAATMLDAVGGMEAPNEELAALRDKANLALGYAYLQAGQAAEAKPVLQRVRLEGPQSNKALLGVGWADSATEQYRAALVPWMELHGRNLLDAAVQESYLAVPFAFAKLNANAQAAEYYTTAIRSYADESARIDESIAAIKGGQLLDTLVKHDAQGRYGWFWQLENLPDAPESRYLYHLLAGHEFQEGLKNYRDLDYMQRNLAEWDRSLAAFGDMLDTRRTAYNQRLPKIDASLASMDPRAIASTRVELESRLNAAERAGDFAALGTAQEQQMWGTIHEIEDALAAQPDDPSLDETRDKVRLLKGVLYWQMNESFKARTWTTRRSLKELDAALKQMEKRWLLVQQARKNMPNDTEAFAHRVAQLRPRIEALGTRLAAAGRAQGEYLAGIAVDELEAQKQRLTSYQVQARFALASIYDRSADARGSEAAP